MRDDGLPVDTDPRVLNHLDASSGVMLLRLLCPSSACRVGHVSKLGSRTVLVVNSVNIVAGDLGRPEKRRQRLAVLLDDPDRPAIVGCDHRQGELIDIAALQVLAREVETGARRRGAPAVVPVVS